MESDDRTLFELMDFGKISEVHKTFVDYFTAYDFLRMKATCDTGAKMAGDLMSQALALHPSAPLESIKDAFYIYLCDVRDMCESYAAAAQAFQQGQSGIGTKMASRGNESATSMNKHSDTLIDLMNNLSKR